MVTEALLQMADVKVIGPPNAQGRRKTVDGFIFRPDFGMQVCTR